MLEKVLLNMILLLSAGAFLPFSLDRQLKWYDGLLSGLAISDCLELSQLIWCRGLFEFDDMFHNSIGCMMGVSSHHG